MLDTPYPAIQAAFASDDERYEAVRRRDRQADGRFVFAVRTTGVYCRPSCPARPARRSNIAFYADGTAARRAGFRPCLRCRPDDPSQAERHAAAAGAACRSIEAAESPPSLSSLAAAAGLGAQHFRRVFKAVTGITPKAYAAARRAERAAEALRQGRDVTTAIYDAGYNAPSRFYAKAAAHLGMRPKVYRDGGAGEVIRFAVGSCHLGEILVAATDRGLCAILIGDDDEVLLADLQRRFPRADLRGGEPDFEQTVAAVLALIEAPGQAHALPLDIRGTAFQQRVWQALQAIPAGRTASYREIATAIGQPAAVRGVAQACAANPLAVAVPCHRVVRSDGGLSGYRWGVERKRSLLALEAGEASDPERPDPARSEILALTSGPSHHAPDCRDGTARGRPA